MLNLVITNGWSDLNAGDSAIIMSIIRRFQIEYGDNIKVSILSELHKENKYYGNSIDKIKEAFPRIEINLVSSPFYKIYDDKLSNRIKEVFTLVKRVTGILFVGKNYKGNDRYIKIINNADIIISKGGHFIHDRKGINSIVHLIKCLYPIIVANKLSKNYFFIAQSFGPFYNDSLLSKINTYIVRKYLNRAKGISVREEVSYEALKKIQINEDIMNKTSDYAFLINQIEDLSDSVEQVDYKYMVITLRQHKFIKENGEFEYLDSIRKICNHVYEKYKIKSLIVPHVKGPNDFENDIIITKKIENMLTENEKEIIKFNYSYLHAKQLVKLYSNAEILIGTRFHSVIFALAKNIPSLAVSYSGYKANIMKQFEMDKFMINIDDIDSNNIEKLKELVDELIVNNELYKNTINNKLQCVLDNIMNDDTFASIKNSTPKYYA